jgi:hypothetical protein
MDSFFLGCGTRHSPNWSTKIPGKIAKAIVIGRIKKTSGPVSDWRYCDTVALWACVTGASERQQPSHPERRHRGRRRQLPPDSSVRSQGVSMSRRA